VTLGSLLLLLLGRGLGCGTLLLLQQQQLEVQVVVQRPPRREQQLLRCGRGSVKEALTHLHLQLHQHCQ
jgi:hypothetical protein